MVLATIVCHTRELGVGIQDEIALRVTVDQPVEPRFHYRPMREPLREQRHIVVFERRIAPVQTRIQDEVGFYRLVSDSLDEAGYLLRASRRLSGRLEARLAIRKRH